MDDIYQVLNSNPLWLMFGVMYVHKSLTALKYIKLENVAHFLFPKHGMQKLKNNKWSFVDVILHDYQSECLTLNVSAYDTIFTQCQDIGFDVATHALQCILIAQFFKSVL